MYLELKITSAYFLDPLNPFTHHQFLLKPLRASRTGYYNGVIRDHILQYLVLFDGFGLIQVDKGAKKKSGKVLEIRCSFAIPKYFVGYKNSEDRISEMDKLE